MNVIWAWVRLDLRRRWKSLAVLTLLVAIAGATVMASLAGARRGASALQRLNEPTLPANAMVLPNTPGFDWSKIGQLPEVAALAPFIVDYQIALDGLPNANISFPFVGSSYGVTIEKPIIFSGRAMDVNAPDEAAVTRQFVEQFHKGVGDTLTVVLPSVQQLNSGVTGDDSAPLTGPRVTVKIVGVGEAPWGLDGPGQAGGMVLSPAFTAKYAAYTIGDQSDPDNPNFINAIVRLRGGEADLPKFRDDIARITGRSDIAITDLVDENRKAQRHIAFEAKCLVAFALAALIAAVFLIGQAIVRYTAASTTEVQTLQALGLSPRQSIGSAAAGPVIVGVIGAILSVAFAYIASNWMPIGTASYIEPSPGFSFDWVIFGPGIPIIVALVAGGGVLAAIVALGAARRGVSSRRSAVAAAVGRAGVGVPVIVGTRFALEGGRGRTAVPVRPALIGAIIGVLGIIAAFTFSQGVSDASNHPERFGQTFQLDAFIGINGNDFGPADQLISTLQANPDVTGIDNARTAVATASNGNDSVALYEYDGGSKSIPIVITSGRLPEAANEVVLGPTTLTALHAHVGDRIPLAGEKGTAMFTVTGAGLMVAGPHNDYADGGWLTAAGYDSIFTGFKFHLVLVTLRPEARGPHAGATLNRQLGAANPGLMDVGFGPPDQLAEVLLLKQVRTIPVALGIFLALLAIGAVGHALATAVRRRSHDLAVLRALGMTQWQCRWVVITQATVLALFGLAFGVPLGLAIGRSLWRWVADYTPLAYVPPMAVWAIALVAPAALIIANLLAAWPGQRAARLRIAHILRTE